MQREDGEQSEEKSEEKRNFNFSNFSSSLGEIDPKQVILQEILDAKLINAADQGDEKEVERLLREGAKVNRKSKMGSTPLHYAAMNDHLKVVRLLLAWKAKTNIKNLLGQTALHSVFVPFKGKYHNYNVAKPKKIIRLLVKNHAEINAVNIGKTTPYFSAVLYEIDVLELLVELGAQTENSEGMLCVPEGDIERCPVQ